MQQVKQIKVVVFKWGYDVALRDAGVPENSPLWANYADSSEQTTLLPSLVIPPSVVEGGTGCSSVAEQILPDSKVPK